MRRESYCLVASYGNAFVREQKSYTAVPPSTSEHSLVSKTKRSSCRPDERDLFRIRPHRAKKKGDYTYKSGLKGGSLPMMGAAYIYIIRSHEGGKSNQLQQQA